MEDLYRLWSEAQDRDRTTWPKNLRCPSDCARCCERSAGIAITEVEAERLARAVERLEPALRVRIRRRISETASRLLDPSKSVPGHLSGPCPLLEGGRCAVYEDRPLPCRAYGFSFEREGEYFGCEILAPEVEAAWKTLRLPDLAAARENLPGREIGPLAEMLDRFLSSVENPPR